MKTKRALPRWIPLCAGGLLALLLFAGTGCETDPSSQISIAISPNTTEVKLGESQEFVASGWEDYTWTLSQPDRGVLSTKTGDRTVYTAVSETNTTQVLTVRVHLASGASNDVVTDTSSSLVSAEALIQHVP